MSEVNAASAAARSCCSIAAMPPPRRVLANMMSAAARRNMGRLLLSFPKFHQVWDSYREAEPGGLRRPRAMGGSLSATPRLVCGDRRFRQRRKALNQARD